MWFVHWARRAASRAAWTAGSRSEIRTAMIAMTTKSSIRVNAGRQVRLVAAFISTVLNRGGRYRSIQVMPHLIIVFFSSVCRFYEANVKLRIDLQKYGTVATISSATGRDPTG